MMRSLRCILFFLLVSWRGFSQEFSHRQGDVLYREDQFYAGVTYNLLGGKPRGVLQNNFSSGFHLGIIRDMPVNKTRTLAIAIGLGYMLSGYNQNLRIEKDATGGAHYSIIDERTAYSRNRFTCHIIELPVEFRWRTSTPTEYAFWRLYPGFKIGYVFANTTKYKSASVVFKQRGIEDFNPIQYGLTLSAGYNTWNLYLYYGLNSIFSKGATLNGKAIGMRAIKIGLMFYIL